MDETIVIIVLAAAAAAGAIVHAATGSGYNLIATPVLALVEPSTIPGPVLLATAVAMLICTVQYRAALRLRDLGPALIGLAPGIALGSVLALVVTPAIGMLAVGIIVLVTVAVVVTGARIPLSALSLSIAGGFAGLFGSIAATPGPPMAMTYRTDDTARLRGNLSAFFLLLCLATLAPILVAGVGDWPAASHTLALCAGSVAGIALSQPLLRLLPVAAVRAVSLVLSAIAGASLLVRGGWGLWS
ncbi:sulfite exporter TauE/SafE family protein [Homoserinibacter sp. YIM 151385]|uniref:sulfite exporter TauE/SafE family protein n=1 Tax=Homoserinibacter sp. YIM 151385 TaxID=2985506 RepID=UPI0022F10FA9|nr:sulfite exporter TauE/SafE family protein [Homoserinibacter sp. YIM 151385]WBU36726.1 sulfite exporter TauE/SafE family protein [Homoserinibacter sp. YIM 151385]